MTLTTGFGTSITYLSYLLFFIFFTTFLRNATGFDATRFEPNDQRSLNEHNAQMNPNASGNLIITNSSNMENKRNRHNSTSILQTHLFLLSHIMFKKYDLIDKVYIQISKDENIPEHNLLKDLQSDVANFVALLELFIKSKNFKTVDGDPQTICTYFFKYTLLYAEYIFERKQMFNRYFDFRVRLSGEFNNSVFVTLVKSMKINCGSVLVSDIIIPTAEHFNKINDFFISLIETNVEDRSASDKLIVKYNKLLLWCAAESIRRFDQLTAVSYLLLMASEDYLSDIIDEVCDKNCSLSDFFSLNIFVLRIVSQLMIPDNFKTEYYSKLASKIYFDISYALVLETVIRMLTYDASEKSISNLFAISSNSTNNFLRGLALAVANTDEMTEEKELFINFLTLPLDLLDNKKKSILKSCKERYIRTLVRYTYLSNPAEIDRLCEFTKTFVLTENIFVAYNKLLEVIMENTGDSIYKSSGILKLAYHLKQEPNQEFFEPLKNKLPKTVQNLVWNVKCSLMNVAYNQYLSISDEYFINNLDEENDRPQIAVVSGSNDSSLKYQPKYQWVFRFDKKFNTFSIQNLYSSSYLKIGKRFGHNKFHVETFKQIFDENSITKWNLELVTNGSDFRFKEFTLHVLGKDNPSPFYVSSVNSVLDNFTRNVVISNDKTYKIHNRKGLVFWTLDCVDVIQSNRNSFNKTDKNTNFITLKHGSEIDLKKTAEEITEDFSNLYAINEVGIINFFNRLNFKKLRDSNFQSEPLLDVYERFYNLNWSQVFELINLLKVSSWNESFKKFTVETLKAFILEIFTIQKIRYEIKKKEHFVKYFPADFYLLCDAAITYIEEIIVYMNISQDISKFAKVEFLQEDYNIIENINNQQKVDFLLSIETLTDFYKNHTTKQNQYIINNCTIQFASSKRNILFMLNNDLENQKINILYTLTISAFFDMNDSKEMAAQFFYLLKDETLISNIFYNLLNRNPEIKVEKFLNLLAFIYYLYDNHLLGFKKTSEMFVETYNKLLQRHKYIGTLTNAYTHYINYLLDNSTLKRDHTSNITDAKFKLQDLQFKIENRTDMLIIAMITILTQTSSNDIDSLVPMMTQVLMFVSLKKTIHLMYIQDRQNISFNMIIFFLERLPTANDRHKGYDMLVGEMLSNPKEDISEIYNFASFIHKSYDYIPCFHSRCIDDLDRILPFFTKRLVENKQCMIRNSKSGLYLYISGPYFVNDFNSSKKEDFVYGVGMGNSSSNIIDDRFLWTFDYVEEKKTFLLKSKNNMYLSVGIQFNINFGDRKLKFERNKYRKYPSEWDIKLFPNMEYRNDIFQLSPSRFNTEEKTYFLATREVFAAGGTAFVSKLETFKDSSTTIWNMECKIIQ